MSTSRDEDPRWRLWLKRPPLIAAVVATVGLLTVGGYFGARALSPHARPSTVPTLDQVEGLPAGAAKCDRVYTDLLVPFNASALGTPMTSCPFAEQVRRVYARYDGPRSGAVALKVFSPTTELQYDLTCLTIDSYVTCSGGAAAVIYLYNRSKD